MKELSWEKIMEEARSRATRSGSFTDDPSELSDTTYLVKDMDLVIKAFAEDIEAGDTKEYNDPEEFLQAHGIEWE